MNELEQKFQRQSLRQIPTEWRAEILAAANAELESPAVTVSPCSFLAAIWRQLSSLLWPHQLAWGGLAVVWILIFALQCSIHDHSKMDHSPTLAQKGSPPSPEMIAELRQQQRLFAELMGPREDNVADRSKKYPSRPRSQLMEMVSV